MAHAHRWSALYSRQRLSAEHVSPGLSDYSVCQEPSSAVSRSGTTAEEPHHVPREMKTRMLYVSRHCRDSGFICRKFSIRSMRKDTG